MSNAKDDLLEALCLPDNFDAFVRRVCEILCRPGALGADAAVALFVPPGGGTPPFSFTINLKPEERVALEAASGEKPAGFLYAEVPAAEGGGRLLARPGAGIDHEAAGEILLAAAKAIGGRLAGEGRERQLIHERDTADATTHLEEVFLAMPDITIEEISRAILDEARRLTGSPFGFAGYKDPATGWLNVPTLADESHKNFHGDQKSFVFREPSSLWGWVLKNKQPLLNNNASADPRCGNMPPGHMKVERFLGAPALAGGDILGLIALANSPTEYSDADLDTLRKLTRVYALALKNKLDENRKRADDARYRLLLDSSSDMIYNLTTDGILLYVSHAAGKFGYTQAECLGRHFSDFVHPQDRKRVLDSFGSALKSGAALPSLSYNLRKKDGTYALIEQTSTLIRDSKGTKFITGSMRDITNIKSTEEKYRALVESTDTGYLILDRNGVVTDANTEYLHLTGRAAIADIIGRRVDEWTAPHDKVRNKRMVRLCLKTGSIRNLCVDYLTPKGMIIPVEINATVVKAGGTKQIVSLCRDISERRQAEARLAESEEQYRCLVENLSKEYFFYRADIKGIINYVSPASRHVLGYSPRKLLTHYGVHLHKVQDNPGIAGRARNLLKKGVTPPPYELLIDHKNGSVRNIEITETPLLSRDGKVIGVEGLAHDITARKHAERALRQSEERHRRLIENLGKDYFFYRHDKKGIFTYLSPSVSDMLGYPLWKFMTDYRKFLTDHPVNKEAQRHTAQSLRGIQQPPYEVETIHRDGTTRWLEVTETPLRGPDGKVTGIEGIAHDITQRKHLETVLKESEEKYRALFETSRDSLLLMEPPGWHITGANKAAAEMLGLPGAPSLLKCAPWKFARSLQPGGARSKDLALRLLKAALTNGSNYFEWTFTRAGGETFPAEVLLTTVRIGGRVLVQACIRDISSRKINEKRLNENSRFLASVVDNIPAMIFVKNAADLKFVRVNKAAEETLGIMQKDLIGTGDKDHFPSKEAAFFIRMDRKVLASRKLLDIPEEKIKTRHGERILHTKKMPILDAHGRPAYLLGISEDITAQKQMENELRASELRMQLAMSQFSGILWVVGRDLRFTMSRGQGLTALGLKPDQLVGTRLSDFIRPLAPDSGKLTVRSHKQALSGKNLTFEQPAGNFVFNVMLAPVRDAAGEITGVLGLAFDMTEKKRLESLVQSNAATLGLIFDTTSDPMYIKDINGIYMKANKACADSFHLTQDDILGKTDCELLDAAAAAQSMEEDRKVLETGRTGAFTSERTFPAGTFYINVVKTPLRAPDGKVTGILGVARDITGVKKMETELAVARASEALSNVARPMAHDFNNALAAINGYATLIDDEMDAADPVKHEIAQIIMAVKRAADLTSKLQTFARNPNLGGNDAVGEKKQ